MSKNTHKQQDGDSQKTSPEPWEIIYSLKQSQKAAGLYATHPESIALRKFSWEGMLTIRFESKSYTEDNWEAQIRRDQLVRILMDNLIRHHWRVRHRHVFWIATTEFGDSGKAHCHILFNFLTMKKEWRPTPNIQNIAEDALESLHYVCDILAVERDTVNLDWQPKYDDFGLVGYFAKKEPGRDYKHFIRSIEGFRWIYEMLEEFAEHRKDKGHE